jgi:anti-sigma regulatory factor (Ser/Thr protein kinase)
MGNHLQAIRMRSAQGTAESLPVGQAGKRAGGNGLPQRWRRTREVRLPAEPSQLKEARRLAEQAADEFGLDEDARFRLTLAANEAVANAIEHGSPSPDGSVLLRVCADQDGVRFEVRDWGTFALRFPDTESLAQRGRGLPMMAALVDEVDLKPGEDGTLVSLVVRGR